MAAECKQVEIRPVTIGELHEHAGDAITSNHLEAGHGELAIDWERVRASERAGLVIAFAAWQKDLIVAYAVAFALEQINTSERCCHGHVVFVMPEHRKGTGLGLRLMRAVEGAADAQGCYIVCWLARDGSVLGKMCRQLDYQEGERMYVKVLRQKESA